MTVTPPMRIAIIGAGAIAQTHADAAMKSSLTEVVAVVDPREPAAQALAESTGSRGFRSIDELTSKQEFDAAIVCSPPSTHCPLAVLLLQRGIHVLCEKPLAVSSEKARTMISAAEQAGRQLTMASKFRHVADVVRAKSLIQSGIIGDVVLFENTFTGFVDMSHRWNSDPIVSGGGVLMDNGTHSVDITRYFLGPLTELQVVEGKRIQELDVEDTVRVFARTHDGIMTSIDLSWSLKKESPYYISVYGSAGTLLLGWGESKYRRASDDSWVQFGNGYNKLDAFERLLENFVLSIRGEQPSVITPSDALASVEVIETAYQSLQESRWHPIKPDTGVRRPTPEAVR